MIGMEVPVAVGGILLLMWLHEHQVCELRRENARLRRKLGEEMPGVESATGNIDTPGNGG